MRALVVAGFFLFGGQLFLTYALNSHAPGAIPHAVLGAGFVVLGAMLFLKRRWIQFIAAFWLVFTVGGRIHFLVKAGVWTLAHVAPAAVFLVWAVAAIVWLVRYNPRDARN